MLEMTIPRSKVAFWLHQIAVIKRYNYDLMGKQVFRLRFEGLWNVDVRIKFSVTPYSDISTL